LKLSDGVKLVQTLCDKERYCVFYRNLQYYIKRGLKVKRVHWVIRYKQEAFMKKYIEQNAKLRAEAKTEFEKYLFKLMNNAVYGKTMENVFKHQVVDFIKDNDHDNLTKKALKKIRNPLFQSIEVINDQLLIGRKNKKKHMINRPIYIGANILDESKLLMYRSYYDVFKPYFNDKIALIYTDTDSFVFSIKSPDIKRDLYNLRDYLDMSTSPYYYLPNVSKEEYMKNKGKVGYFKIESGDDPITSFIAIRPKQYSMKTMNGKVNVKSKGISRNVIAKDKDKMYEIMNKVKDDPTLTTEPIKQTIITSKGQMIMTKEQIRMGINGNDNKKIRKGDRFYAIGYQGEPI
jgi:hypothetical protein